MKSKLFKLFILVVLVLIGISVGIAQPGQITRTAAGVDSAFRVYTSLGSGVNGYDTTTYTGIASPFIVRGAAWGNNARGNALPWTVPTTPVRVASWGAGVTTGGNYYIQLAQKTSGFRLVSGDTIFFTFSSRNSNYRARFQFDTSKSIKIYTSDLGNTTRDNQLPVMHFLKFKTSNIAGSAVNYNEAANNYANRVTNNILGTGTSTYRGWNPSIAPAPSAGAIDSGKTKANYGGNTDNNTVSIRGFNPDTLMVVIDSNVDHTTTGFPSLYFSDFYVQAIDSLLQGRGAGVSDTLLVIVGRGPNGWGSTTNWATGIAPGRRAPGEVGQNSAASDVRVYQPTMTAAAAYFATQTTAGGEVYGGTPVFKLTLLPGAAKFVRWNVGIDPAWSATGTYPVGRLSAAGSLIPTARRQHWRVRHTQTLARDMDAFRATDTASWIFGPAAGTAWQQVRDTLYIFDRDSNLTIDSTGSTTYAALIATGGINALDSALTNSPIYPNTALKIYPLQAPRGRLVMDWQMTKIVGRHIATGFRTTKIRLASNITTTGFNNDTLNSPTPLTHDAGAVPTTAYFKQGGTTLNAGPLANYVDSTILYRAATPSQMTIQYRKDSVSAWIDWTGNLPMSSTEVQTTQGANPVQFRTSVKDTFANVVDNAVTSISANVNSVVYDTNWRTPRATGFLLLPNTANYYGWGSRYINPWGTGVQPATSVPGTTEFTLYARNDDDLAGATNAWDDYGVSGGLIRFYDNCMQNVSFTFKLSLMEDTVGTNPMTNKTYARTASGSSTGAPTYLRLSAHSANGNSADRSSSYPVSPDTIRTTTVDMTNTADNYRNIDTVEITITDDCERPVALTDTALYNYQAPLYVKNNGTGLPSLLTPTVRRDSVGSFIVGSKFIPAAAENPSNNKMRMLYKVPNMRHDTVKLTMYYVPNSTIFDNIVFVTVSGPANSLTLVRPAGNNPLFAAGYNRTVKSTADSTAATFCDSVLYASENLLYSGIAGTYNPTYDDYANTYTFIKGITSDINGDTVDQAGAGTQAVTWKLLSPIATSNATQSLLIADASYIFGETAGLPNFGALPVKTFAEATAAGKTGRTLSITLAGDGNAYALLVTDRIGGGGGRLGNWTSHHVFPAEKATAFPGNFVEGTDSLTQFLGNDGLTRYNISDYVGTVKDNGRGFNKLVATFMGNLTEYTADPKVTTATTVTPVGKRQIIYHVIPDTTQDLRVAWLDMSGDLFASATGDVNDKTELRGRQTAKVMNVYTSTTNETTLRRLAIKGTGNSQVGTTNINHGALNYPGAIDILYVREYDRFGNPILREDWQNNIQIGIYAHKQPRKPFANATRTNTVSVANNRDNSVDGTYYIFAGPANSYYASTKDSNGVFLEATAMLGTSWGKSVVYGVTNNINAASQVVATYLQKWAIGDTAQKGGASTTYLYKNTAGTKQLRGAVGVKYQTMWADSSTAEGRYANFGDVAELYVSDTKCSYPDTAFVVSSPVTVEPIQIAVSQSSTLLSAVGTDRTLGTIGVTSGDLFPNPGYPMIWFNNGDINSKWLATNLMSIQLDTPNVGTPTLALRGENSLMANSDPKWVLNPDPPIYDMPGMDHIGRTSFVKGYYSGAYGVSPKYYPTYPSQAYFSSTSSTYASYQGQRLLYTENTAYSTYAGGGYITGTSVQYKGYRDGLYKIRILKGANSAYNVTQYNFTNIYRFYPDGVHFVTMTNPNSNHPELEPTDPRPGYGRLFPVRSNYFVNGGHYNPDKQYVIPNIYYDSIEQYNGLYSYLQNLNPPNDIRNYSSLGTVNNVDTVFYNQDYKVTLRVFDRFGNLIKKPRLWLSNSVQFNQPFPTQNILTNKPGQGTQLNEWPVMVDTNAIKDTLLLCDTLIVRFVQTPGDNTPAAMNGQLMLKYSNQNGSQNQSLLVKDTFNLYSGHDAPVLLGDSRVMASRNIFVRAQQAPGAFTITPLSSPKLVRLDNDASTWTVGWTKSAPTNLLDDSIRYNLVLTTPDGATTLTTVACGYYPLTQATLTKVLDKTTLVNALGLGAGHYNRDVKWYVVAANRWGLTTTSTNSDVVTVELNAVPTVTIKSIRARETDPALNTPVIVNPGTSTMTLTLDQTDPNGIYFGTAAPYNVTSYGVTYPNTAAPIDSLFYQVTLTWNKSYPGTTALPTKVDVINTINPWKVYSNAELLGLLGSEDSVTYNVLVKAVDRAVDTVNSFAAATATATGVVTITKIDGNYYAVFTQDSLTSVSRYASSVLNLATTDSQTVKITVYDSNGDVIRGFKNMTDGTATPSIKLKINITTPATIPADPLQIRVISYTNGTGAYTTATIGADGSFTIPLSIFDMGVATFKFQDRRAHETVNITMSPADNLTMLKMVGKSKKEGNEIQVRLASGDTTLLYHIVPGVPEKVKTVVTPRRSGIVFLLKAMEVIITPTDKYNNEILTLTTPPSININLVVDDDVLEHDQVGNRIITGKTWVYLTPMKVKDIPNYNVLKVGAFLPDPNNGLPNPLTGAFVQVLVVNHIPVGPAVSTFQIKNEQTSSYITDGIIKLQKHSDKFTFTWGPALDSNNAPLKKSFAADPTDKRYWIEDQCVIKYTFKVAEYLSYPFTTTSDTSAKIVINAGMLKDIYLYLRQSTTTAKSVDVNYFIIFEDDVYKYSMPMYADKLVTAKKKITLTDDGITALRDPNAIPTVFSLDQNYPNPFNPTTTINYALPKESNVKITVYNVLGQPVRTLVNERQAASYQTVVWDGKNDKGMTVSSGTYIYTITAGDFVQTKKMNLLK